MRTVRRSKLELYTDIICALAKRALTVDEIAFQCSTNCLTLQEKLDFLAKHDVVSVEVSRDNRASYVLTRRGVSIFKTFRITKNLEKLQNKPESQADEEAMRVVSELEQRDIEEANGNRQNQNR